MGGLSAHLSTKYVIMHGEKSKGRNDGKTLSVPAFSSDIFQI